MRRPIPALVAAALTALTLVACSTPLPEPTPEPASATAPPALGIEQVERILADLNVTLGKADAEQDGSLLEGRLVGPALAMREAEYVLAAADETDRLTKIPEDVQRVVVPTSPGWPRVVMAVTEPPEDLLAPLLLVLVQDAPRSQYTLWSWSRLFPGAEVPSTMQPSVGSEQLASDAEGLLVTPTQALTRYIHTIGTQDSEYTELFTDDDLLSESIIDTRTALRRHVGDNGKLTEVYEPTASGPFAIATAEGGAIVVGAFRTKTTITLDDSTLTLGDETARLLGKRTFEENLAITYLTIVAFHVPPEGTDGPIVALGAEHTRSKVTGK